MPKDLSGTSYSEFIKKQMTPAEPTDSQYEFAEDNFTTRQDPPLEDSSIPVEDVTKPCYITGKEEGYDEGYKDAESQCPVNEDLPSTLPGSGAVGSPLSGHLGVLTHNFDPEAFLYTRLRYSIVYDKTRASAPFRSTSRPLDATTQHTFAGIHSEGKGGFCFVNGLSGSLRFTFDKGNVKRRKPLSDDSNTLYSDFDYGTVVLVRLNNGSNIRLDLFETSLSQYNDGSHYPEIHNTGFTYNQDEHSVYVYVNLGNTVITRTHNAVETYGERQLREAYVVTISYEFIVKVYARDGRLVHTTDVDTQMSFTTSGVSSINRDDPLTPINVQGVLNRADRRVVNIENLYSATFDNYNFCMFGVCMDKTKVPVVPTITMWHLGLKKYDYPPSYDKHSDFVSGWDIRLLSQTYAIDLSASSYKIYFRKVGSLVTVRFYPNAYDIDRGCIVNPAMQTEILLCKTDIPGKFVNGGAMNGPKIETNIALLKRTPEYVADPILIHGAGAAAHLPLDNHPNLWRSAPEFGGEWTNSYPYIELTFMRVS